MNKQSTPLKKKNLLVKRTNNIKNPIKLEMIHK